MSDEVSTFEVTVLDNKKKYYRFKWQVEKYNREGGLKNCWLTTAVSQPILLGSSIQVKFCFVNNKNLVEIPR